MRIFIPAHFYEDSFVDNVQITLSQMGYDVFTLGEIRHTSYWSTPRYLMRVAASFIVGSRPSARERAILLTARRIRPDTILALTTNLHPEILHELGKLCPGRRILWWGDSPANSTGWGIVDPGWDFVYLKDRVAVEKVRLVGGNAFLLHEAMNPIWHKPLANQANGDVAVVGNYYSFRQALILRLMKDNIPLRLYGSKPPRWAHPVIKRAYTGHYVTREDKSLVFGEAMASLNTFAFAEGDSLNCRAFEIAGAGGLQLIEHRPVLEECFEPGKEVLAFRGYEELIDHLYRTRRSPNDVEGIRRNGAQRALAEHTYEHRLRIIFRKF